MFSFTLRRRCADWDRRKFYWDGDLGRELRDREVFHLRAERRQESRSRRFFFFEKVYEKSVMYIYVDIATEIEKPSQSFTSTPLAIPRCLSPNSQTPNPPNPPNFRSPQNTPPKISSPSNPWPSTALTSILVAASAHPRSHARVILTCTLPTNNSPPAHDTTT